MKKSSLIIAIILILAVIGIAYLIWTNFFTEEKLLEGAEEAFRAQQQEQQPEQPKPTSLTDCQGLTGTGLEVCYKEVAKVTGDKTICARISTDWEQNNCYFGVACETGDISICEDFENELGPTYSTTALCYKCVAIKNQDELVCDKIRDTPVQEACYNSF